MKIDERIRHKETQQGHGYRYGLNTLKRALTANAPPELIASCCVNTLSRIYGGYFRSWLYHTHRLIRLKRNHLAASIWNFYHRRVLGQDQETIEKILTGETESE